MRVLGQVFRDMAQGLDLFQSRKLHVWELRLVPHEVSLGLWGRVWGGRRGVPILDGFCSCPAGHGRFSGIGFWVVFGQDFRSLFWVSFGRFSGAFQEVHEGIWGGFWACLELIVGRRTSVPRPVHCQAFVPARGSQVPQTYSLLLGIVGQAPRP